MSAREAVNKRHRVADPPLGAVLYVKLQLTVRADGAHHQGTVGCRGQPDPEIGLGDVAGDG